MAINPNTTFVAGAILTADQQNRFPRGVVASVVRTTAIPAITGATADLTGMTVTFTADATRLYKASWLVTGGKVNAATDQTFLYFTTGANVSLGNIIITTPTGNYFINLCGSILFSGVSGSVTYKLRVSPSAGTFTAVAGAGEPCILVIEDIGPA
jgi:hypothetical protein